MEIYIDMDGVCTDFISAALRLHGFEPDQTFVRWAQEFPGEFYPYKVLNLGRDEFWDGLLGEGEEFWVNLEPYPWYNDLIEVLQSYGQVIYCTSPTRDPACVAGKMRWLQHRHGHSFRNFIFTAHKDRLAHSDAILIDDYEVNTRDFSMRGGNGILFPQFWNSESDVMDKIEFVTDELDLLMC